MSKFDSSHAQCSHSCSAVNISSPSRCCSAWFRATALCKEQLLANIRLKSSNTLPFGAPIGFKWPNVVLFYSCRGTSAPFSLAPSASNNSHLLSPFPLPSPNKIWFLLFFSSISVASPLLVGFSEKRLYLLLLLFLLHRCQTQTQLWDRTGWNGQRQLRNRQRCYSKIRLESEVLSVSVNQGTAKWLKPSISAPSEGSEILLHDS